MAYAKATKLNNDEQFEKIFNEASAAGEKALSDDLGPLCGFGWVTIKPATSPFVKWLVKNNLARKHSGFPGVTIWIRIGGQSYWAKRVYAEAMAEVFRNYGILAEADDRVD